MNVVRYCWQVGGDFTDTVMMNHMKIGARAVIVGAISLYNVQDPPKGGHSRSTRVFTTTLWPYNINFVKSKEECSYFCWRRTLKCWID